MNHTRLLLTIFWEIFLIRSLKNILKIKIFLHTILLRFMLKFSQKCHFQKNSNPFTSSFTTYNQTL
jgi:hypothetical protein